jgi:hypothetical protein
MSHEFQLVRIELITFVTIRVIRVSALEFP